MHGSDSMGAPGPGGSAGVQWERQLGGAEARLGPVAFERVALRREAAGARSGWVAGEVVLLNQTTAAVAEATLHILLRDPAGRPLTTDWELLPPLAPGAQVRVAVRTALPGPLALGSVSLSLTTAEPVRCSGHERLGRAPASRRPDPAGGLRVLGVRAVVEDPDEDGDQPLVWLAEVDHSGPPLTEVELALRALDDGGALVHEEVLAVPPVLPGRQVLSASAWCTEPGPIAALDWTLRLCTPRRHGPVDLPWAD